MITYQTGWKSHVRNESLKNVLEKQPLVISIC